MGGASGTRVVALPPAPSVDAVYRFGPTSASAHLSAVVSGGTTGDYKLISRPDALQEPAAPSGNRKVGKKKGHCMPLLQPWPATLAGNLGQVVMLGGT